MNLAGMVPRTCLTVATKLKSSFKQKCHMMIISIMGVAFQHQLETNKGKEGKSAGNLHYFIQTKPSLWRLRAQSELVEARLMDLVITSICL